VIDNKHVKNSSLTGLNNFFVDLRRNVEFANERDIFEKTKVRKNVILVSAYWHLSESKYGKSMEESAGVYKKWMKNSTSINAPFVFYTSSKEKNLLQSLRGNPLPTLWIDLNATNCSHGHTGSF